MLGSSILETDWLSGQFFISGGRPKMASTEVYLRAEMCKTSNVFMALQASFCTDESNSGCAFKSLSQNCLRAAAMLMQNR